VGAIHVGRHATPGVSGGRAAVDDHAGASVAQRIAVGRGLVHGKHLEPGAVGVEVAHMQSVTMSQSGGIEQPPVMVYRGRAVDNLIGPVAIHVGHAQVVIAHAKGREISVGRVNGVGGIGLGGSHAVGIDMLYGGL